MLSGKQNRSTHLFLREEAFLWALKSAAQMSKRDIFAKCHAISLGNIDESRMHSQLLIGNFARTFNHDISSAKLVS